MLNSYESMFSGGGTTSAFKGKTTPTTLKKPVNDYRTPVETKVVKTTKWVTKEIDHKWVEKVAQQPIDKVVKYKKYKFLTFYHTQICTMIRQLNRYGISGLLNPPKDSENAEMLKHQAGTTAFNFKNTYKPGGNVDPTYPTEGFDFDFDTPYGGYNWELFFHGPLMIASRLSQNQKFEAAQKWFHYIFDPTNSDPDVPAPRRYWQIKPFRQEKENTAIDEVLAEMNSGNHAFRRQVTQWMKNPFQPHAIARLRTVSYMKAVTMKYLDNLIAWGDNLFRRDSIESINEATQLYILAQQILGPKSIKVEKHELAPRTVEDMLNNEGGYTSRIVEMESEMADVHIEEEDEMIEDLNSLNSILFFCTSPNDKLLSYWDTVEDRLFKIRHCMNIDGVTRSLNLFEAPIDPGLLVKASAAGIDLGSIINSIAGTNLPNYRFRVLVQKALDLCNDVKALGGAILSALEKKDAEELSLIRANQEIALLNTVTQLKQQNIEEATANIPPLEDSRKLAETRQQYYSSREYMNKHEEAQLEKMEKAMDYQKAANLMTILGAALSIIPKVNIGVSGAFGSPVGTVDAVDGVRFGQALNAVHQGLNLLASIENHRASKAGIKGGYDRRMEDWELQATLAEQEIEQINKQITAAEMRIAIAETDLKNHEFQIEQATEIAQVMEDKYTNKQLYNWMITQISGLYFQSYQLAFDVARMAEQAYNFELGTEDKFFIQFGHWDSLKKGLFAGERLQADIRRMEIAFLEQNKREYELTKHIPLSVVAPDQLVRLREEGVCDFQLPEVFFDLDHPGHYMRRIKSVSVSIPCVTGPYTNVNAKLTLMSNRMRKNSRLINGTDYAYVNEDSRFRHDVGGIRSLATSSGQNDSGMFELNFNDDRYLPFEGSGAISSWRLELSSEYRQFDYDTIADVVLHMNYTAREGGEVLRTAANGVIEEGLNKFADVLAGSNTGLAQAISLKTQFPNQLHQLLQAGISSTNIDVKKTHFPHFLKDKNIDLLGNTTLMVKFKDGSQYNGANDAIVETVQVTLTNNGGAVGPVNIDVDTAAEPLPYAPIALSGSAIDELTIGLGVSGGTVLDDIINSTEVEDIYLVFNYEVN